MDNGLICNYCVIDSVSFTKTEKGTLLESRCLGLLLMKTKLSL